MVEASPSLPLDEVADAEEEEEEDDDDEEEDEDARPDEPGSVRVNAGTSEEVKVLETMPRPILPMPALSTWSGSNLRNLTGMPELTCLVIALAALDTRLVSAWPDSTVSFIAYNFCDTRMVPVAGLLEPEEPPAWAETMLDDDDDDEEEEEEEKAEHVDAVELRLV